MCENETMGSKLVNRNIDSWLNDSGATRVVTGAGSGSSGATGCTPQALVFRNGAGARYYQYTGKQSLYLPGPTVVTGPTLSVTICPNEVVQAVPTNGKLVMTVLFVLSNSGESKEFTTNTFYLNPAEFIMPQDTLATATAYMKTPLVSRSPVPLVPYSI